MAPRKRSSTDIEDLVVRYRDVDNLTFGEIGKKLKMGKGTVFKIYTRKKNPPPPKKMGRPWKTDTRSGFANLHQYSKQNDVILSTGRIEEY